MKNWCQAFAFTCDLYYRYFLAPLAVNQLMAIPLLYWPSFFLFTGVVEGQPLTTVLQTLHRRLPALMKANLAGLYKVYSV